MNVIIVDKLFQLENHFLYRGRFVDIIEEQKIKSIIQIGLFKDNKNCVLIPTSTKLEIMEIK